MSEKVKLDLDIQKIKNIINALSFGESILEDYYGKNWHEDINSKLKVIQKDLEKKRPVELSM
ncbi:MAG: hypothetical protein VYD54_13905 [Bdellovibrionota bacterium]|nr:hypothetical protein [Bdellovibrionota bacterium]